MNSRIETAAAFLKYTFGFVFIGAGLDKATNYLTNWSDYLWGYLSEVSGIVPETIMIIVGFIELVIGSLMLIKPHIGAYAIMSWLILIGLTLLGNGEYLDIAVRDLVLAVSAFTLAQLVRDQV